MVAWSSEGLVNMCIIVWGSARDQSLASTTLRSSGAASNSAIAASISWVYAYATVAMWSWEGVCTDSSGIAAAAEVGG